MLMRLFQAYDWHLQKYQVPNPPPPQNPEHPTPQKTTKPPQTQNGLPQIIRFLRFVIAHGFLSLIRYSELIHCSHTTIQGDFVYRSLLPAPLLACSSQ